MKRFMLKKGRVLFLLVSVLGLFLFTNCEKDDDSDVVDIVIEEGNGVFVINEGGFGSGNSSLSYINYSSGKVDNNIFEAVNERKLGDVFFSVNMIDGEAYLVVNNSEKIEVINPVTLESIATIDGLNSPRYILPVNENMAYVSDLFDNNISIVNTSDHAVESEKIEFPGWSEAMEKTGDNVFVAASDTNMVYVIDSSTRSITDSIEVFMQPNSMIIDKEGDLWVFCSGEWEGEAGGLMVIDSSTLEVKKEYAFEDGGGSFSKLAVNQSGDKIYYILGDVWEVSIDASELPEEPLIESQGRSLSGLGICPSTDNIFIGNTPDYEQNGKVFQYNEQGEQLEIFDVGIAPSGFYFY